MANQLSHDKMCTLWEEVAESTGMNMTLSKDLEKYDMSDMANKDRASDLSDNSVSGAGVDREWIPQDYRFTTKDGIVSSDSDFEDIIDRNIPVNRGKSKRILAQIDAKGLRDPMRRQKVAQGMARDIANAVDTTCYQTMLNQASMVIKQDNAFSYQDAIDAEVLMLNRGLGGFNKKLFLSNEHYAKVAKDLGQNQYYGRDGVPNDALTRAKIPDLATFDTMRSDYLIRFGVNGATGLTINGDQSHTVSTYDSSNEFYQDNRFMTLAVTGSTPTTMPVGTKFTIEGVNAVHPETRTDNGELQTFTVVTTGTGTVTIAPAIVVSGPYQNCTAQAGNGNSVTVLSAKATAPSLFYTPESTVLVPGRLPVPSDGAGVTSVEATTDQALPMRMTYTYDFHKEVFNIKALVYFDCQVIYPDMVGTILDKQA